MKPFLRLLTSIALCQAAGLMGSLFTVTEVNTWYKTLLQPTFAPPSWVFGPVWTTLYTLMGIALFLVWQRPKSNRRTHALIFFCVQLALNALWTPVFFGLHAIGAAFALILVLLISIAVTIFYFYKIRPGAAYLLVPYILWVLFATVLNGAIWQLN
jgi:tryptophan-rich sensory protein